MSGEKELSSSTAKRGADGWPESGERKERSCALGGGGRTLSPERSWRIFGAGAFPLLVFSEVFHGF